MIDCTTDFTIIKCTSLCIHSGSAVDSTVDSWLRCGSTVEVYEMRGFINYSNIFAALIVINCSDDVFIAIYGR